MSSQIQSLNPGLQVQDQCSPTGDNALKSSFPQSDKGKMHSLPLQTLLAPSFSISPTVEQSKDEEDDFRDSDSNGSSSSEDNLNKDSSNIQFPQSTEGPKQDTYACGLSTKGDSKETETFDNDWWQSNPSTPQLKVQEADSQLSKLDCSRSPIVDSPVSIPNLLRMHHLIFLALENCRDFFTSPPFLLPKGTFVWAFHGGKFHWNEPDNCVLLQDMKKKRQFYLHQNVGTTKDAADFAIVLIVGMMHERLPMGIPFTIVSGDMRFLEVECQMKTEQKRAIVVDPHIRTKNSTFNFDDADDGVKWNKEDPPSGKARHVEQYREADESEDFIDLQSKSKGKKGNFTPSDLMLPGSSHNVASTRSEEADSQLSKLDCSKSPIVDSPVSTPNLSRMRLLIFLDLDNYSCFFTHPPFSLPDETFVWAFQGGKVRWRHPRKCVLLQNMKQRQQFYLHQRCGTTKDATDYAIVLKVGMMHERLPKEIPFKIVSGDKGFLEVERQIKTELRTVDVVDPHKTLEVERQMKTEQ
ncbi:uncharacterized protein LOC127858457 isoform X3 [Dreissena polymorpha]|uniref:uncharacterized protein LOC127858457 isoform X3 n=1 Tax=Dreissena polymorpha TaxID=45954 RepID=UPI002264164F|nr:uncharacterized protein LOC127858457 isoform X3 [Dreissena polymorpha]